MAVPVGKNPLGETIKNWLLSWGIGKWLAAYNEAFHQRMSIVGKWLAERGLPLMYNRNLTWLPELLAASFYLYTGIDLTSVSQPQKPPPPPWQDPSKYVADMVSSFMGNAAVREAAETVGAAITTPFLSVMEGYAGKEVTDPHEIARAFHGTTAGLALMGGMADTLAQGASAGLVRSIGPMFASMYWNMGLGFLGWQTLAPLLSNGLQPPLERYYARLYRPMRFNAAQMGELFSLGEASGDELAQVLRDQGWRDPDIERYRRLSYKRTSESEVWKLYNAGQISRDEVEKRLRGFGYDPQDIPLQFRVNDLDHTQEAKEVLVSTAKSAFQNRIMSESEFRAVLAKQHYPAQEIDLEVQLIKLSQQQERAELSRADIRQLLRTRTIARPEALAYLTKTGLAKEQAELLISSWEESDAPTPARINQSTIRAAFVAGVLDTGAAIQWLNKVGYDAAASSLLLKTWQTELAIKQPLVGPLGLGKLSLAQLENMYQEGLLTADQIALRPELNRYSDEDKALIIRLITTAQGPKAATVSLAVLTDAYRYHIIDRTELVRRLVGTGLTEADAELQAQVIDQRLAEEQARAAHVTVKRPSVGALQLALQRGLLSVDEFDAKMKDLGFDDEAINIYRFNAQYQSPSQPQDLSKTDVLSLYKKQKLTRSETQYRLVKIGYTVEDARLLIEAQGLTPDDTEIGQAWIQGLLDTDAAAQILSEYGFSAEEIQAFFARYTS
jgi:hypothetical protein